MCGIIAAASNRNVSELLVEGLHKMEYRGYDSAGLALHQESNIAHIRTFLTNHKIQFILFITALLKTTLSLKIFWQKKVINLPLKPILK